MAVGTVGSPDTGIDPFDDWITSIVSPTHVLYPVEGLFGPGTPHSGPYDNEGYTLFTAAGVTAKQNFMTAEFTAPLGIMFTVNVIPGIGAISGSSVDSTSGPILSNALFPFFIDGDMYQEGVLYDPNFDSSYPGYNDFSPPIAVDGASHFMLWFGENSSFAVGVAPEGSYDFKISVVDALGAGWDADLPFTVEDSCPSCGGTGGSGAGRSGSTIPNGATGSVVSD